MHNAMLMQATTTLTRRELLGLLAGGCATGALSTLCGCGKDGAQTDEAAPTRASAYEQISTTLFAFDTVVSIKASCAQKTLDAAAGRCRYFESIFSRTIPTSDIGRINEAGGEPVEVAPQTSDIIRKALAYCEESDGRFDITIGAVSSLWDFKEGVVPSDDALAEAVRHVDYTKVRVDGNTVKLLDPAAKLDLGGIAKGYIADDLCALLQGEGCRSGFVNLGGNVKTIGVRPDGKRWHVGIQDPNEAEGAIIATVSSKDSSVVTSGLYERQFGRGSEHYWHILDPATGLPVQTDLMSASILSSASIDGDGYTKPLFMMGLTKALEWIDAHEGIEGIVVGMDGAVLQSKGCDAEVLQ